MVKFLFFFSAAVFFFTLYFHNVIEFDQDLGRHLLTGKIIWQTHQVPQVNLYSYTFPNFLFINTHWLSEVIFYLVGVPQLVFFKTMVMMVAMMLTLWTAFKYSKSLPATMLAFAVFAPVLLERTEIRPEIFSHLFIAIFMYVLLLKPKLIWLLAIIQFFWVNLHIYFILGPILVAIYCLSANRLDPQAKPRIASFAYPLSAWLVFLTNLLNPNFISGAIYPFTVFGNYGYSIVENQNIFFLRDLVFNPNIFYFGLASGAFIASFFLAGLRKLTPICYLLAALIVLPIMHIRSFPLLFLIELPVFAYCLNIISQQEWFFKRMILFKNNSFLEVSLIIIIGLTFFRSWRLASNQYYLSIDSHKRFGDEIRESGKGALDFVIVHNLHGPIFNNFDIGSYLDYRLYPKEKVFVDGRPEAYPAAFFQNIYIPMQENAANFAIVDNLYKFNLIIFSRTDGTPWGQQFLTDIVHNAKFNLAYIDDSMVVFVRQETYPQIPVASIPARQNNLTPLPTGLILF